MSKDDQGLNLRQRAEMMIKQDERDFDAFSADDIRKLAHDLSVHQIELEIQNEHLKQTQEELLLSKNSFVNLFDQAPVGYLRVDEYGSILQSNRTVQELLGYGPAELNGKYLANFIYQEDLRIYTARFNAFFTRPENKILELRISRQNTEPLAVELKGRLVDSMLFKPHGQRKKPCLLINVMEVGRRRQQEEELKLAAKVFESSEEGIMIVDTDCKILKVNFSFTAITGYESDEAIGKTPRILKSGRHGPQFYEAMWRTIKRVGSWQGEIWNRRKNGDLYTEWLSITSIQDRYGRTTHYIGIFSDITVRKQNEEQIEKLAHFDILTELPNRILLNDRLKQAVVLANRHRNFLTVLFLDLDRFKVLNDSMGHFVGDMMLQEVAKRLVDCVRESDTVARFGGDEFVIVLSEFATEQCALEGSEEIASQILQALSTPFELQESQFNSSTSIGMALYPKHGQSVNELIKNADTAMYHAKSQGRNNIQVFSDSMHSDNLKRSQLANDLQNAMRLNQFLVYYQPKVDLNDQHKIIGLEALVRWQHPEQGLVFPDQFIACAEESGLIVDLGEWVLLSACQQLKKWHDQGLDHLTISVNLSARQFLNNNLIESIRNALKESGLDARFLELEITETVMMENMSEAIGLLKNLVRMGCTITLDDFGTGYASLTYLKRFPVHCIKIDRSFIRDVNSDPDDQVIVNSILSIARLMGMKVIAEGIETEQQAAYLGIKGCAAGQGRLFSEPLPAAQLFVDQ